MFSVVILLPKCLLIFLKYAHYPYGFCSKNLPNEKSKTFAL